MDDGPRAGAQRHLRNGVADFIQLSCNVNLYSLNLAALPSKNMRHSRGTRKEVECFLLLVPGVVLQYLTQAEVRIASSHSSVRKLAAQSVSISLLLVCIFLTRFQGEREDLEL